MSKALEFVSPFAQSTILGVDSHHTPDEEELCSKAYSDEECEEELDDLKVLVDMVGEEAAEGMIRAYLVKQGLVPGEEKTLPTFHGESLYTHALWDIVNRLDQLSLEIKEIIERSL